MTRHVHPWQKAKELLMKHMTPAQLADYQRGERYIRCKGSWTGLEYLVPLGGGFVRSPALRTDWCITQKSLSIPAEDAALAKKLMIETNEFKFVNTANSLNAVSHTLLFKYGLPRYRSAASVIVMALVTAGIILYVF